MLPVKTIVAPTDFSDVSIQTVSHASELAQHFGAVLIVLHVIPPVPTLPSDPHYNFEVPAYQEALKENAERQLSETIETHVGSTLPSRSLIAYGDPAKEIVRIASEEDADLIILATHGLTGWQHIVFGSVAERVVRTARVPVLTVRARPSDAGSE